MCAEMASHPPPYGSDIVSRNCGHLAASKIPKGNRGDLSSTVRAGSQ